MSDQEESNKLSEDEDYYDFTILATGKFDLYFNTGIFSIQLKFCGIP